MGIKQNNKNGEWIASYSKRNQFTGLPVSLRRCTIGEGLGKRKIRNAKEAQRVYNDLVLEVEKKMVEVNVPSWKEAVDTFLAKAQENGYSGKTIDCYRICLSAHTLPIWGDRSIESITAEEIRQLINVKLGARSESHKKNMRKYINAVFNQALEGRLIKANPTPHMKFRVGDKIMKVLTEIQAKQLLAHAKSVDVLWYPHWVMALYTGMRTGELYALTWDKINLDQRQILVDCAWNNVDGFTDTKSGDDRIVEIAPDLVHFLKELKLSQYDSNFVLPRIDKWDRGDQARELRMFLLGCGLPAVRFHDLRATWATILLSQGVPPIKVMIMGGWKDLKTMQKYIRKAGVDTKGATDKFSLHDSFKEFGILVALKDCRNL